ncbi:uncharacterized protein METZ01_LOCUS122057 [marine metagenome]|uniref:Uncharacterized protein n=1 Tax=marine metagenome TaxID=408172 RepID=A0A381XY95_9ZZZZ
MEKINYKFGKHISKAEIVFEIDPWHG